MKYKHVVRNRTDINLFTNGIDELFLGNKIVKSNSFNVPLRITYAGNIGYGQGLEKTVINIAQYFKDKVFFQLVGDGSSVNLIKEEIKRKKIKNVKF